MSLIAEPDVYRPSRVHLVSCGLAVASLSCWVVTVLWMLALPLAVASLVTAIVAVVDTRHTGADRETAWWSLALAVFVVLASVAVLGTIAIGFGL